MYVHAMGNTPLLSVHPQSQQNGEGAGAALRKHCATELIVSNSLNNLIKLIYPTSATPPYYLGGRNLFYFLT